MDELTRARERILIDCFRAFDAGVSGDDCLTRYPTQADSLRGVLDMRAQLLTLRTTAPSPTTFASGREALLARVVRPLASSHPGSMETEGRQARGLSWRPATRAAFAGALLFAMASCAIGVSATPAADKIDRALPNIPAIDVPDQRPPYPFPQYNAAPPDALPTTEPDTTEPVETAPQPSDAQPPSDPAAAPSDSQDENSPKQETEPTKPDVPGDNWLPPVNAHESDPPDVTTPTPDVIDEPSEGESPHHEDGSNDTNASDNSNGSADDGSDGTSDDHGWHRHNQSDGSNQQNETPADTEPASD